MTGLIKPSQNNLQILQRLFTNEGTKFQARKKINYIYPFSFPLQHKSEFMCPVKITPRVWKPEHHQCRGARWEIKPMSRESHGSLAKLRNPDSSLSTVVRQPPAQVPMAAGCQPLSSWSRTKPGLGKGNCSFLSESSADAMLAWKRSPSVKPQHLH